MSNDIIDNNKPIILTVDNELCLIEETIYNLIDEMDRYIYETKKLWDNHISQFIESSDCLVFDNIGINGYDKFYDLMINQKTFKLMKISLKRLQRRKQFLIKNR